MTSNQHIELINHFTIFPKTRFYLPISASFFWQRQNGKSLSQHTDSNHFLIEISLLVKFCIVCAIVKLMQGNDRYTALVEPCLHDTPNDRAIAVNEFNQYIRI